MYHLSWEETLSEFQPRYPSVALNSAVVKKCLSSIPRGVIKPLTKQFLYSCFVEHYDFATGQCNFTNTEIASNWGTSERTIKRRVSDTVADFGDYIQVVYYYPNRCRHRRNFLIDWAGLLVHLRDLSCRIPGNTAWDYPGDLRRSLPRKSSLRLVK